MLSVELDTDFSTKHSLERKKLACQIREARETERQKGFESDRGAFEYYYHLGGLRYFFAYVRKLGAETVLDIGAGSTKGVYELAQDYFAQGLRFESTNLGWNRSRHLKITKPHITSVELLKGISQESVGGVMSVYSVGYSRFPKFSVSRIDQVLVKGGVFKGIFADPERELKQNPDIYSKNEEFDIYQPFLEEFIDLGYDTYTQAYQGERLMVAIKRLKLKINSAEDLFLLDMNKNPFK